MKKTLIDKYVLESIKENVYTARRALIEAPDFWEIVTDRPTNQPTSRPTDGFIAVGQDFCKTICILLGNFAVLFGNYKFQTLI